MSIAACAALVEKGDPDRFLATMAAPPAARERLFPLYAFNLEVARAPWVTEQPLIAEMRLQFWHDVLEDPAARAHEVAGPLHQVIHQVGLDAYVLHRMIDARRWDISRQPHGSFTGFGDYLEDSAGGLMWLAGQALGAPAAAEPTFRRLGWAAGLANYFRAVPQLKARGLAPLPDEDPAAIRALAEIGLEKLGQLPAPLGPAALAGWLARPVLTRAARAPSQVLQGGLDPSEFTRRGRLLWTATTGRF